MDSEKLLIIVNTIISFDLKWFNWHISWDGFFVLQCLFKTKSMHCFGVGARASRTYHSWSSERFYEHFDHRPKTLLPQLLIDWSIILFTNRCNLIIFFNGVKPKYVIFVALNIVVENNQSMIIFTGTLRRILQFNQWKDVGENDNYCSC